MYKPAIAISFVLLLILQACIKNGPATPELLPDSFTSGLHGMHNWHGHHFYQASGPGFPTPITQSWSLPDTSFSITVINDTTVSVMGVTFPYSSSDSVRKVHYFGMASFYYTLGPGHGEGIAYYYSRDSIVYYKEQDAHSTTDQWLLDDHYYTY